MIKIVEKRSEHTKTAIELYPTQYRGKAFMIPAGWSREVANFALKEFYQTMLEICDEEIRRLEGIKRIVPPVDTSFELEKVLEQIKAVSDEGFNSAIDQQIAYWSSQRDEIKNLENHQP